MFDILEMIAGAATADIVADEPSDFTVTHLLLHDYET